MKAIDPKSYEYEPKFLSNSTWKGNNPKEIQLNAFWKNVWSLNISTIEICRSYSKNTDIGCVYWPTKLHQATKSL